MVLSKTFSESLMKLAITINYNHRNLLIWRKSGDSGTRGVRTRRSLQLPLLPAESRSVWLERAKRALALCTAEEGISWHTVKKKVRRKNNIVQHALLEPGKGEGKQ